MSENPVTPAFTLCGSVEACTLSSNQRRLLERMRTLGYGVIRKLHVRAGEPVVDPPPLVIRVVRTGELPCPNRLSPGSFVLRREQMTFLRSLEEVGDGVIDLIKVHDGLPVVLEIPASA